MKKNSIVAFAFILAILLTGSIRNTTFEIYHYMSPNGSYTQADVENENNWQLIGYGTAIIGCPTTDEKACEILVSPGNSYDHDDTYATPDRLMPCNGQFGVDLKAIIGYNSTNYIIDPSDPEYLTTEVVNADNKLRTIP